MSFYGSGAFAGAGNFYSGTSSASPSSIPQDLRFYRTSVDGQYVFWWGFKPEFISPALTTYDFDLQLDVSSNFTSPNLVTFNKSTATTFQNGNVRKGFAVPVAARINATEQTWYARVRTHAPSFISGWSSTLTWTIPESVRQLTAEALLTSLSDSHVYGQEDVKLPVTQRKSLLYTIDDMYGQQFDAVFYENLLTGDDNYVELCRDEFLYQNFGIQFNFTKPISMQYVDYRWILMSLIAASLVGSTNEAVNLSISAFTGVNPTIISIRDELDFFLGTIQDAPIIPSGSQSIFYTSQPYIDSTLVVEDITTGLIVSSGLYTTDGARGTWTMNTPTTHTLQATFDIGMITDPISVIFDGQARTSLTGTALLTNGSDGVVGFGTAFTTEITPFLPNAQITDNQGIYLGLVNTVTDDTHLTLLNPWAGPTETTGIFRLTYTDVQLPIPINWDADTLAFGVIIIINNPGLFVLN